MARPVKVMQSYRLPETLVDAIAQIADEDKMDKVDIIIKAIEDYIARRERRKVAKENQP